MSTARLTSERYCCRHGVKGKARTAALQPDAGSEAPKDGLNRDEIRHFKVKTQVKRRGESNQETSDYSAKRGRLGVYGGEVSIV